MSPPIISPDFQAIAKALPHLVARRRWLGWRFGCDGKNGQTKVPCCPRTRVTIDATNAANLCSFEEARECYENDGALDGVGYALDKGDIALDLDHCRDPGTGEFTPWAIEILKAAKSYCETTVSGTGARAIGAGNGAPIHKNLKIPGSLNGEHIEIYRGARRFVTVTGAQIEEYDCEPRNIDEIADSLLRDYGKTHSEEENPQCGELPDEGLLDSRYMKLLREGVEVGKRSTVFHAVVCGLRDENGLVPDQLEALMRKYPNGIGEKYKRRLRVMIDASWRRVGNEDHDVRKLPNGDIVAIDIGLILYSNNDGNDDLDGVSFLNDAKIQAPSGIVKGVLPPSGIAFIGGQSGAGKSFVAIHLAICIASGSPFFGRKVPEALGVVVIVAEGEGSIWNRIIAAAGVRDGLPIAVISKVGNLSNKADRAQIIRKLKTVSEHFRKKYGVRLGVFIIDTVAMAFDLDDENANAEVTKIAKALLEMEAAPGALAVAVHHYGKTASTGLRGGSGWRGNCNAVLSVTCRQRRAHWQGRQSDSPSGKK